MEPFYPLHVRSASSACWCSSRSSSRRGDLHRLRVLLLVLGLLGRSCPRVRRVDGGALRTRRTARSSSSPATTAICSSTSSSGASRRWASSPRRTWPRSRPRERDRDAGRVLRRELAPRLVARGLQADLLIGNNVLAQVPDLNDFVAGMRSCWPRGRRHDRVSPSAAADRGEPVRHDLPRALLLLLVPRRPDAFSPPRAEVFDVEELPTHGGSLRIYAQREDGTPPGQRAGDASSPSGAGARLRPLEGTRRSRPACERDQVEAARVPDRGAARASGRRLRRARARATRCSTTAGSAPTCSTSRSIATRTSRASSCPGTHIPSTTPRRSSRPGPITS